jgi:hypothetical protein
MYFDRSDEFYWKIVMECVIETKASMLLQFIDGLRGDVRITFEEGTWAAWLYDLLKPHVSEVVVCDPFITATGIAGELGVAFTTAQRAIGRLERVGILKRATDAKRDRVYCAQALLDILEEPANLTVPMAE